MAKWRWEKNNARNARIYEWCRRYGSTTRQMAEVYGLSQTTIARVIREYRKDNFKEA